MTVSNSVSFLFSALTLFSSSIKAPFWGGKKHSKDMSASRNLNCVGSRRMWSWSALLTSSLCLPKPTKLLSSTTCFWKPKGLINHKFLRLKPRLSAVKNIGIQTYQWRRLVKKPVRLGVEIQWWIQQTCELHKMFSDKFWMHSLYDCVDCCWRCCVGCFLQQLSMKRGCVGGIYRERVGERGRGTSCRKVRRKMVLDKIMAPLRAVSWSIWSDSGHFFVQNIMQFIFYFKNSNLRVGKKNETMVGWVQILSHGCIISYIYIYTSRLYLSLICKNVVLNFLLVWEKLCDLPPQYFTTIFLQDT